MMCIATNSNAIDTVLITTVIATSSLCIHAFASGWDLPLGDVLSGTFTLLPLSIAYFSKIKPIIHCKASSTEKYKSKKSLAKVRHY